MMSIQFGSKIIQAENGPVPMPLGVKMSLRQKTGHGTELFLTARKVFARWSVFETHAPVGAMRTDRGVTTVRITLASLSQRFGQGLFFTPATAIIKGHRSQFRKQGQQLSLEMGCELLHIGSAGLGNVFSGLRQLGLPGIQSCRIPSHASMPKQGIALTQGALVTTPMLEERLFHVEHSPIEVAAPLFPGAGNQGMGAGFETDDSAMGHQITQRARRLAIQMHLPSMSLTTESQSMHACGHVDDLCIHAHAVAFALHQRIPCTAAEGTAVGKQIDRFQHAALAGPVGSDDQVDAGIELETNIIEAAQALDLQATNVQSADSGKKNAGRVTTRRARR